MTPAPDRTAPRMMQSIWPKKVGEDTVALDDAPDRPAPRWIVDADGDIAFGNSVAEIIHEPDTPYTVKKAAYDALVADVAAARTLEQIKAEFNSYEDVVGDPYDCSRFVGFISDLLTEGAGDADTR